MQLGHAQPKNANETDSATALHIEEFEHAICGWEELLEIKFDDFNGFGKHVRVKL